MTRLLRNHPLRVALVLASMFIAGLIGLLAVVTISFQESGPTSIRLLRAGRRGRRRRSALCQPPLLGVTCPGSTLRAGSRVLCTAELRAVDHRLEYRLLSVDVVREEGEISAELGSDSFVSRAAGG